MIYAFGELLPDIGKWFIAGVLIAGAIGALLTPEVANTFLADKWLSMIVMLVIAVPMYVCATSSTPIAAALALKGLSPGAAMVFLLAGPATNAASIAMVSKILGKKATAVYLASIVTLSILSGIFANYIYDFLNIGTTNWVQKDVEGSGGLFSIFFSIVLLSLIAFDYIRKKLGQKEYDDDCQDHVH